MADFIESARAILSNSERRMEATANNVANLTTPGFKTQHLYSEVTSGSDTHAPSDTMRQRLDFAQGRMSSTGNPLDVAISGGGMFRLHGADGIIYSRQGQFRLAEDGRVINAQGMTLQQADGGDLVLGNAKVKILADGTVLDDGRPVAKIGLYRAMSENDIQPLGGSLFKIADDRVEDVTAPELRQGMVEASNVALGDEMVSMMAALRDAESGARLVQLYDDLMGKAVTAFGQGGR